MQTDTGRVLQGSCSDERYEVCVLCYENWGTGAVSDKSTDGPQNAKSTQPFEKNHSCGVLRQGYACHLTNLLHRDTKANDDLRIHARIRF